MRYLILCLILSACVNQEFKADLYDQTDLEVDAIFEKFQNLAKENGKYNPHYKNVYFFKKFPNNGSLVTHGECDMKREVIFININTWFTFSQSDKELFIFHELGHCYLRQVHLYDSKNCHQNIMCEDMASIKKSYSTDPAPFIKNLFNP